MKQSVYNIIAIVLLIAGVGYLNIVAIEKQKEAINKIDIVMDKIMFFGNNNYTMSDLLDKYNGYKKSIPTLASYYENDNELIVSLNEIKDMCKKYNVELDKLSPKLNNTLNIHQNAIPDLSVEIERYNVELLIRGAFLNIGKLINVLSEKNYLINSMEINSNKNDDQVDASLDLFVYRSKPNLKVHDNSISIEKINSSIPKVPNEALPNNLKWKNDIFSVSRLSNKKGVLKNQKSFKKEYLLTQIILSKPLGAIINNNLHPIGSKIGPYTVSKISENTVVLSGKRKSIVLELEIDEDQFVYSLDGFKKAFSNARKKNQTTFIYRGKLYSTRLDD